MQPWEHDHTFHQDERKPGEARTLAVVCLTAATMVWEIVAGIAYGSMALLADGLHMASHATALALAMVAYVYARRRARDDRFSFGTGKVNSLAGYTGAILLALFALLMAWESVERLLAPVTIAFDQALLVACVGLAVNGLSVLILDYRRGHSPEREGHSHDEHAVADDHDQAHDHPHHHDHFHDHGHGHAHDHGHDHNLRSAYLHVLADALTSMLAIVALLAGKYAGLHWLDPVMGIVGAVLVARWSMGLMKISGQVLLDRQGPEVLRQTIRTRLAEMGGEVADLHLWSVGPGMYALIVSVVSDQPRSVRHYRAQLGTLPGVVHMTVEVWPREVANADRS
jgi:cation diffusion facilitator family transporter